MGQGATQKVRKGLGFGGPTEVWEGQHQGLVRTLWHTGESQALELEKLYDFGAGGGEVL